MQVKNLDELSEIWERYGVEFIDSDNLEGLYQFRVQIKHKHKLYLGIGRGDSMVKAANKATEDLLKRVPRDSNYE